MTGLWVFHVTGGRFNTHIQLWNIWSVVDSSAPFRLAGLPVRWWNGTPEVQVEPLSSLGRIASGGYAWTLDLGNRDTITFNCHIVGDTAFGSLLERTDSGRAGPFPIVGVRIPALIAVTPVPDTQLSQLDTVPIVLLRLDDIPPTDRDFASRLKQRGLWAELAIPTQHAGIDGDLTWNEIRALVRSGFSAAAHSRTHGDAPVTDAQFLGEVVGSLVDLAFENLPTPVFVQPGTWQDSLDFISSVQLHTWRGSIFRTFTRDFEAYVYTVPRAMPMADSLRLGLGHYTFSDGVSNAYILTAWRNALVSRRFTVIMIHSWHLNSPDQLDWFLDSVAVAKESGRMRLAHSTAEVFTP